MDQNYAIMSDMHTIKPKMVQKTIKKLTDLGFDSLVFNGDIIGDRSGIDPVTYLHSILKTAGESGLEVYVQPGSHENSDSYQPVIEHITDKYPNVQDALKMPTIEKIGHDIVFLPGSDFMVRDASYKLENGDIPTGTYETDDSIERSTNMKDLEKLVTDAENTILFSHVPAKYYGKHAPDNAIYGEVIQEFKLDQEIIKIGSIFPGPIGYQLAQLGAPIQIKQENRGNLDLGKTCDTIGINKKVSGHFHESKGNAITLDNKQLPENTRTNNIAWNASYMDGGLVGALTVHDDGTISHQNLNMG
ncbi:MAG: metallophosphoesterase [DPANN group archaeon]|nr:metallophosphoesterase [DPANN group archaeon]